MRTPSDGGYGLRPSERRLSGIEFPAFGKVTSLEWCGSRKTDVDEPLPYRRSVLVEAPPHRRRWRIELTCVRSM